ncbi:hypothetical protein MMC08_006856 [Hypocenomyce scalaris]|nr:hypothetical protein [Hypocenomyce scalaris]
MARKIVLAAKIAKVKYFIMVGGTGSLYMPGMRAYRRAIAEAHAHTTYLEERLGPMGLGIARISKCAESEYEDYVRGNDKALQFITACGTSFKFFDGNTFFRWTFMSPSALYRPGKRTGAYEAIFDYLPVKGDQNSSGSLDGRLHGISAADLAVAIADEAETQERIGRHWSAYADMSDDTPAPSYVTL